MSGPPPTDKKTLQRRGSRLYKDRAQEMATTGEIQPPPESLTGQALVEWRRVIATHEGQGTLSAGDYAALTVLCVSIADFWNHHEAEQRLLSSTQHEDTHEQSQLLRKAQTAKQEAFTRWRNLAAAFGLTPADRTRVKVGDAVKDQPRGKDRFKPKLAV